MGIKEEKERLAAGIAQIEEELVNLKRKHEKLEKVQDIPEPLPGTVLRFSRPLGRALRRNYTFVASRVEDRPASWYVAGKQTTLQNLLHLTDGANTWEQLLLAIGDAKIEYVSGWSDILTPQFDYFLGYDSGKVFRSLKGAHVDSRAEVWSNLKISWQRCALTVTRGFLVDNPGSYLPITWAEAEQRGVQL